MKFTKFYAGSYRYKNWEIVKLHGAWRVTKGSTIYPSEFTWASTLKEAKEFITTKEAK
jgi:hypothetical protein